MQTAEDIQLLIQELELKNRFLLSENRRLEEKLAKLCDELRYLRRTLFGRSSERFAHSDPNQLAFDFYAALADKLDNAGGNVSLETGMQQRKTSSPGKRPVRKPLPDYLERRSEIIEPENLPEGARYIGKETTEILEYIPGILYVREIIRKKYALKNGDGVIIGSLPGNIPLPKSNAGSSLLAHLLVSKYQDHQPYYRQIEILKRQGVQFAASTVNRWNSAAIDLLRPLYDCLKKEVLDCDYIQVDESVSFDWNYYRVVLPIPKAEMNSNPNMQQNPTYGD